ncbi:transposase [Bacillus cereus]
MNFFHLIRNKLNSLLTIPGVKKHAAASIIAEVGVEMGQFPSAQHLASWAGLSPGNHESAGKKKVLEQQKEIHTFNPCFVKWHGPSREPVIHGYQESIGLLLHEEVKKKALIAIAHKVIKIIYHILDQRSGFIEYSKILS